MVRVKANTTDHIVAWRVRDALAAHPLLGGATAQIEIVADYEDVVLDGWALDSEVVALAIKLARRVAGRRTVLPHLHTALTKC
ncbi:MAG: BON domain-containing protein [Caldilineaceae bacterium]